MLGYPESMMAAFIIMIMLAVGWYQSMAAVVRHASVQQTKE